MDITAHALKALADFNRRSGEPVGGDFECPSCGEAILSREPHDTTITSEDVAQIRSHALSCRPLRDDIIGRD